MHPLRVSVRIRPLQAHDGDTNSLSTVVAPLDDYHMAIQLAPKQCQEFTFDRVFGPHTSQQSVFRDCALPLVDAVLEGTNACIFAFGATGAGKTYSMLGPEGGRKQDSQTGLLPRAAAEIFRRLARQEADAAAMLATDCMSGYEVRASFLEIYKENAFDLLNGPVSASRDATSACALREDRDRRVFAEGAKVVRVTSASHLLAVVAKGAQARSTAATGVHAHSSRSHALLMLEIEHRWKSRPDDEAVKSQVARLTLVDLAGAEDMERAHGGYVDAAGVGTNMGLLVLGRVIRTLAEGCREHVPYRDSTLTRLMQTCLGGSALTHMLACISPAPREVAITLSTLGYATSARCVKLSPQAAAITEQKEDDPMLGDVEDSDIDSNRRCIWIETSSYGDVFARCVGDPEHPLILYVHGSGPQNSSMVWNDLALEMNARARTVSNAAAGSLPPGFYHVAIDCPGYGRSPGDRQIVRSYPGGLISECIKSLSRRCAVALVGSSQGAAAVFNAALEKPDVAHLLAVVHPVGHAPHRFSAIAQPTLLIFDTEDAGHPVSVGRQMRRYLPNPRYFEFTRSRDGDWECQHTGEEMWKMITEVWPACRKRYHGGRLDHHLPERVRVAGGLHAWSRQHNNEVLPWYGGIGPTQEAVEAEDHGQASSTAQAEWRAVLEPVSNTIVYQHVQTGRMVKVRPPGARVLIEPLHKQPACKNGQPPSEVEAVPLFQHSDCENDESCDEEEVQARQAELAELRAAEEMSQTDCHACQHPLVEPVRLFKCRCALCACCVERTVRYTRQCPACGTPVAVQSSTGGIRNDATEAWLAKLAELVPGDALNFQHSLLTQMVEARRNSSRLVLEYGNTSQSAGSKISFTTFLKVVKVEGSLINKKAITHVDFNINPGYSKPTASCRDATDKKLGFTFEYAMARPFPCVITAHSAKEVGIVLTINYTVQTSARFARRIIIEVRNNSTTAKPVPVTLFPWSETDAPPNAWVRRAPHQQPQVELLPVPSV
mmetsp:Transcript_3695/g.9396  ORF Transcript_3695/g.9396 Transcript_3695/m.9396 type:complete len:1002 (+) Transcript_3695:77-3082(+)